MIDEDRLCVEVPNPYVDDPGGKVTFIDTVPGLMKVKNVDIYVTGSKRNREHIAGYVPDFF